MDYILFLLAVALACLFSWVAVKGAYRLKIKSLELDIEVLERQIITLELNNKALESAIEPNEVF